MSTGQITTIPGVTTFPLGPPKKISVSKLGVIFRGSPLFLAVLGHSHFRGISTLNFGLFSTKLGGTLWAIKKMTKNDNGPEPGWNREKPFVHFNRDDKFRISVELSGAPVLLAPR